MPIFSMQVERLPTWVHRELNKDARKCIWGEAEGNKGVHLLSWDCLCKPKELGSTNMKSAKDMNHVLMAKLAWRVLNNSNEV